MSVYDYDLVVIGAGPGGYVAAIRATQLGLKTAIIERDSPGGVCLNWGCIPSKALISQAELVHEFKNIREMGVKVDVSGLDYAKVQAKSRQAADRLSKGVQALIKKNGIELIKGSAVFESAHTVVVDGDRRVSGKFVLIATGSRPRELPGFEFDHRQVMDSSDMLALTELPKRLLIMGAGAIGMEFAYVMNAFGVEVTVVEMLEQILPVEDAETVEVVEKAFKRYGIKLLTATKATKLDRSAAGVALTVADSAGATAVLEADKLLVAVGRAPNTEGLELARAGVSLERGFVQVGDYYQTGAAAVYAIGDVIATPLLAHVASKEGEIAVEHMAGHAPERRIDPMLIPSAVYCEPQVGSFGLTERRAKEAGLPFKTATFPYRGAGKSVAVGKSDGMVKIVYHANTQELLGGHIVGANATELVHELLLAKKAELMPHDIATMVHAHPTLSEAVMEAMRAAEGWAIHV